MGLRFDDSYLSNRDNLDVGNLYLEREVSEDGRVWAVKYGEGVPFGEGILFRGEELRELLEIAANNGEITERLKTLEVDTVVRNPEFKSLARSIPGIEMEGHLASRTKVSRAFRRAFRRAKIVGKGIVKISRKGYSGRLLEDNYWRAEVVGENEHFRRLGEEERKSHFVTCVGGRLSKEGRPFSTENDYSGHSGPGYSIFAIGPDEDLYCGSHSINVFHHSSFLGDGAVFSAGEIHTDPDGKIDAISNKSGHYKPGDKENLFALRYFRDRGVNLSDITFSALFQGEDLNALEYLRLLEKADQLGLRETTVGKLLNIGVTLEVLESFQSEAFMNMVISNSKGIASLLETRLITLEQIRTIQPEDWRTEVIERGEGVSELLKKGFTLEKIRDIIPAEFRRDVMEFGKGVSELLEDGFSLGKIRDIIPAEFRRDVMEFGKGVSELLRARVGLEELKGIEDVELRRDILESYTKILMFLREEGVIFDDVVQNLSSPEWRKDVLSRACDVSELLRLGVTLRQLRDIRPEELRSEIILKGHDLRVLLREGVPLEDLINIQPPEWREEVFSKAFSIAPLLEGERGFTLEELKNIQPLEWRNDVLANSRCVVALLTEFRDLESLRRIEPPEWRETVISRGTGVVDFLRYGFSLEELKNIQPPEWRERVLFFSENVIELLRYGFRLEELYNIAREWRYKVILYSENVVKLLRAGFTLDGLRSVDPEEWRDKLISCKGLVPLFEEVGDLEVLRNLDERNGFQRSILDRGEDIAELLRLGVTLNELQDIEIGERSEIIYHSSRIIDVLRTGITFRQLRLLSWEDFNEVLDNPRGWNATRLKIMNKVSSFFRWF